MSHSYDQLKVKLPNSKNIQNRPSQIAPTCCNVEGLDLSKFKTKNFTFDDLYVIPIDSHEDRFGLYPGLYYQLIGSSGGNTFSFFINQWPISAGILDLKFIAARKHIIQDDNLIIDLRANWPALGNTRCLIRISLFVLFITHAPIKKRRINFTVGNNPIAGSFYLPKTPKYDKIKIYEKDRQSNG